MTAETVLYIVIAGVLSFALAVFMYGYKTKYKGPLRWLFAGLRFLSLFALLLLFINPKFTSETYRIEKPKLPILVDNTSSIGALEQTENLNSALQLLQGSNAITSKFDVAVYPFGDGLSLQDTLTFSDRNTEIAKALTSIEEIYQNETAPTILISDGNQTFGTDYEFSTRNFSNPIYPVILGDSTKYLDLKIQQLNTNRYAFLKNQFPVEVILVYSGVEEVRTEFVVNQGASVVYREAVRFTETNNTKTLSFTLPASRAGLQRFSAQIVPLSEEKNTTNNRKQFAVEVIDQATNVLIVSKIVHPDLGTLRKAIETNEQRTVTLMKPEAAANVLNDYQLVILYQPDRSFAGVFRQVTALKKNTFLFTGLQTDWNFLNNAQEVFQKEFTLQDEAVTGQLNPNYGTFAIEDIGFNDLPPLQTDFGELQVTVPHEVVFEQSISGFTTGSPLLATTELNGKRDALWDAEGLWKWRARSFVDSGSFLSFDTFLGKLVQYLASNKRRSRLEVTNETFYYNNIPIRISAQYFDQNFVFDPRATLLITVTNQEDTKQTVFPMLLRNNYFEVDLTSLPAGEYKYTVSVRDEAVARSGSFTILDFDVEQQFLNANVTKLTNIATNTGGIATFSPQTQELINSLLEDNRYQAIQKSEQKTVPLIDWKYLLALIVLLLTIEWFIRKYNGLI